MAELKTKETNSSVDSYLDSIPDERRRTDCRTILKLMMQASNWEPRMWGTSIVGFGNFHYKYESGREGDTACIGFSSRKQSISVYLSCEFPTKNKLMSKLGKHKTGKACLYINKLDDVNVDVLKKLIEQAVDTMKQRMMD